MTFEGNLKWNEHMFGSGGLLSNLNQRLFFIRRLKNHMGLKALLKVSDSLFNSKIRYGLQLLGNVRWLETDPLNQDLHTIQKCQNKLLRVLNGSRIKDMISTKSLLAKMNFLSVNQMNAQIKLSEMWKAVNVENYPVKINLVSRSDAVAHTRAVANGQITEDFCTTASQKTFLNDAKHIWNKVPNVIKECKTLLSAKKAIKCFVTTLPT